MAKVILPGGVQIDGLTPKEAAEAAREFLNIKPAAPVAAPARAKPKFIQRAAVAAPRGARGNGFDIEPATVEFLEAIKAAGLNGVPVERIQTILHADTPKGIGGRMVRMKGYLRRLGFSTTDDLFHNPKNRKTGKRAWKPKQNLDAAIEAAKKAVKG